MRNIKVEIVDKAVNKYDLLRGIGVHTTELLKELKKIKNLELRVSNRSIKGFDIYHYPKFNPYYINLPFFKKGKLVVTIHDLIPLIFKDKYPPRFKR
ncbi:hypothetical protein ACFL15_02150 [Patescibacteria group bacterium]